MLRGHFKSLAIYSLITALLASPVMAATPGAASRRAAQRAKSARQASDSTPTTLSNSNLRSAGNQDSLGLKPISSRQSSGNPSASTNSRSALLPSLFGGSSQSSRTSSSRQSSSSPQSHPSASRGSDSSVAGQGILNNLFGSRPSQSSQSTTSRAATTPPAEVNWDGIPYHQAKSKPAPKKLTPIRDPNPNEMHFAGPSRLAPKSTLPTPRPAALPKPPALVPAPSSRRSASPQVASSRTQSQPTSSPALSPLSSSRRSGRRELPTLDASEIAAAKKSAVSTDSLVPKVVRKTIEVKAAPEKTDSDSIAKTKASPAVNAKSSRRAVATTKPSEKSDSAKASDVAKATPAKTPSADVATITNAPQKPASTKSPEQSSNDSVTAPLIAKEQTRQPAANPATTDTASPREVASAEPAPSPKSQAATEAPAPLPAPTKSSLATAPAPATPEIAHSAKPQFVAPRFPVPAAPSFGGHQSASHRIGPPASAFQQRVRPTPVLNPANAPFGPASSPIGSGVATLPHDPYTPQPSQAYALPGNPNGAPRVAQNIPAPTQAPAPQKYAAPAPISPSSSLGAPQAMVAQSQIAPQPSASHPAAAAPYQQHPSPYAPTPGQYTPVTSQPQGIPYANQTYQAPSRPRVAKQPSTVSELPADQTAVASELPGIRVVTHGPKSVTIRQTHEFEIRVENRGSIDAEGVMVRAAIPSWAEIRGQTTSRGGIESQPQTDGDRLVWTLDSLPAGTTEKLLVRLQALESGTHQLDVDWTTIPQKSVAKIEVREPKLDLIIEGPDHVVFGESQTYKVRVLNPGDGIAPNVVFTLSPNSSTPQTQRIGNIPSGKEAQFEVELTAQDLGDLKIHGLAAGELGLKAQAQKSIQVASADLEAVFAGPEMQYQNTDANYHLQLTNNGDATCKNVTAVLSLPPGIRYLGGIDQAKKLGTKLTWNIDSLPPGSTREYDFNCTMVSPGKQSFDFTANGTAAGKTAVTLGTQVESIADLVMTITDPVAPAPVGSEVIYEIVIKNRGSRQAQGVRAIAQFSNGIEPRRLQGHTGQVLTGQVLFDPIDFIRPGEEVRIRVIAEAESEGHHRFRTEIRSGETVLVAEEATQYLKRAGERVSRRSSSSHR